MVHSQEEFWLVLMPTLIVLETCCVVHRYICVAMRWLYAQCTCVIQALKSDSVYIQMYCELKFKNVATILIYCIELILFHRNRFRGEIFSSCSTYVHVHVSPHNSPRSWHCFLLGSLLDHLSTYFHSGNLNKLALIWNRHMVRKRTMAFVHVVEFTDEGACTVICSIHTPLFPNIPPLSPSTTPFFPTLYHTFLPHSLPQSPHYIFILHTYTLKSFNFTFNFVYIVCNFFSKAT